MTGAAERGLDGLAQLLLSTARELQAHRWPDGAVRLTQSEAAVMRFLDGHPDACPAAVAEATGLQRSNLSPVLRVLEARGFVARSPDPVDERRVRLNSTELAADNLERLRTAWAALVGEALEGDERDVDAAVALLARLERNLIRLRAGAPPSGEAR